MHVFAYADVSEFDRRITTFSLSKAARFLFSLSSLRCEMGLQAYDYELQ